MTRLQRASLQCLVHTAGEIVRPVYGVYPTEDYARMPLALQLQIAAPEV